MMFARDDPGLYSSRTPKHVRLSRMQRDNLNGGDRRSKQPRALRDGNWVCEDPDCKNVNYPRRTECNKCARKRGEWGDAVVRAYMETIMISEGEMHHSPSVRGPDCVGISHSILTQNGHGCPQKQISSFTASFMDDLGSWIGQGYERASPFLSQSIIESGSRFAHSSTSSASKEGKRLAERLILTFAASHDPLGDAGECLASAALWLQKMKACVQIGDGTLSPPAFLPRIHTKGGASSPHSTLSSPLAGVNGAEFSRGSFMHRVNGNIGIRTAPIRPNVSYEDYKDRPSDYLREFGDPAAVSASSMGCGLKPEPGVHGNWECDECRNVNFPRRTNCFQCHRRRGARGDQIVRQYVHFLIEEAGGLI